jgi:hypothetical protein
MPTYPETSGTSHTEADGQGEGTPMAPDPQSSIRCASERP